MFCINIQRGSTSLLIREVQMKTTRGNRYPFNKTTKIKGSTFQGGCPAVGTPVWGWHLGMVAVSDKYSVTQLLLRKYSKSVYPKDVWKDIQAALLIIVPDQAHEWDRISVNYGSFIQWRTIHQWRKRTMVVSVTLWIKAHGHGSRRQTQKKIRSMISWYETQEWAKLIYCERNYPWA